MNNTAKQFPPVTAGRLSLRGHLHVFESLEQMDAALPWKFKPVEVEQLDV